MKMEELKKCLKGLGFKKIGGVYQRSGVIEGEIEYAEIIKRSNRFVFDTYTKKTK